MGFEVAYLRAAGGGPVREIRSLANQQYARGDMLKTLASGLATRVAAADKGAYLYMAMQTPPSALRKAVEDKSTTFGEACSVIDIAGSEVVMVSPLTGNSAPQINGLAVNVNAGTGVVLANYAGAANDFNGGLIYCPELDQTRVITSQTVAAGVATFNLDEPFGTVAAPVALTTGNTIIVVPFNVGSVGVKFNATTPWTGIGTLITDQTGGFNKIEGVDLKRLLVYSSCPATY